MERPVRNKRRVLFKRCTVCFLETRDLEYVFDDVLIKKSYFEFYSFIGEYLKIPFGLPTVLCCNCMKILKDFYELETSFGLAKNRRRKSARLAAKKRGNNKSIYLCSICDKICTTRTTWQFHKLCHAK